MDLRPAPFLDSMGLGMIVAITKRIRTRNGSLHLVCTDHRAAVPLLAYQQQRPECP
ncbi:STAS domain-containing protein [Streptomyces sp. NPDC056831]|uniref:STAS domain-containing protein n=1 Tax=Streptomyces sp. NPDC056831 TaxID=3345954 RepID=UPI0036CAB3E2